MLVAVLTAFTLVAFAANSVLCRVALGADWIDPVSFTSIRLAAGAAVLVPLAHFTGRSKTRGEWGSWGSGCFLFLYAAAFSLAYRHLEAGTGALILFGSVQATMIGSGLRSGEQPHLWQWLGLLVALGGLVYLVSPGIAAPDPLGALLMAVAGICWGVYSLRGKGRADPLGSTSGNFVRSLPLAAAVLVPGLTTLHAAPAGMALALLSGGVTSGLGYVVWYRALRGLSTASAAIVQLLVPILAALGGVVFLGELFSLRLAVSSGLVLGGVAAACLIRRAPGT